VGRFSKLVTKVATSFECGECGAGFKTKKEADDHCLCPCGRVVAKETGWRGNKCALCRSRDFLRDAHLRVRRLKSDLADAEKNLAKLKTEHADLKAAS
jgi:DNA-directed RNA polymerase subunit RPC12/RpoP